MKVGLIFSLSVFVVNFATAQSQSTGLQPLEVGPTAAELSTSEAAVATPNGSSSIYTNPALLSLEERPSLSFGYTNWIEDSNNLFGGINLKKGNRAVAFSFYTSGVTGIEQRDEPGESNGEFSVQYVFLSGAYSYQFKLFSFGLSAHYLNEEIFPYRASGYAVNFGLATSLFKEKVRLGTSLLNLGEMNNLNETATELPTSFNFGVAIDVLEFVHFKNPELPILATLMTDIVHPINNGPSNPEDFTPTETYLNLGLKLLISEVVELRAGYKTNDNARPSSFGLGFIADRITFNYAIVPFNTGFGTVHSIGLQYQL